MQKNYNNKDPEVLYPRTFEDAGENQYKNFFGRGEHRFAIYPSYWKDSWGPAPLLGIVAADNAFLAERLAYDRGILPTSFNCTFQPKIKILSPKKSDNSFNLQRKNNE